MIVCFCMGLMLLASSGIAQTPVGHSFTYQGRLNAGGAPASGNYQFEFRMYDSLAGGNQVGSTLIAPGVEVDGGLFSVVLDFDTNEFGDSKRWLEIAVGPEGSPDPLTTMLPRSEITPAPQSVTAQNALKLGEVPANKFQQFQWTSLSADATAESNTGYMITNEVSPVTITLPEAVAVGDVVRVNGVGSGGWKMAQAPGQSILATTLEIPVHQQTWMPRDASRNWYSVASSSDGTRLVACVYGGRIHTSIDSGRTWTQRDISRSWISVASSTDGTRLVACVEGGFIYTSTDSGVTWTQRGSNQSWRAVASSADGTLLAAGHFFGGLYTSSDSGVTWIQRATSASWYSIASSADGTRLVACAIGGRIYTSTDTGVTWTPRDGNRSWNSVASSSDGTRLVAADNGGLLYTSIDSGITWTPRESVRSWSSVASSADGMRLVAGTFGGQIYVSSDGGISWSAKETAQQWNAVASSADGTRLVASVYGGQLFTSSSSPLQQTTTGISGFVTGSKGSAVELQHIGGEVFQPLSAIGSFGGL